jgi:hypothetical protein
MTKKSVGQEINKNTMTIALETGTYFKPEWTLDVKYNRMHLTGPYQTLMFDARPKGNAPTYIKHVCIVGGVRGVTNAKKNAINDWIAKNWEEYFRWKLENLKNMEAMEMNFMMIMDSLEQNWRDATSANIHSDGHEEQMRVDVESDEDYEYNGTKTRWS